VLRSGDPATAAYEAELTKLGLAWAIAPQSSDDSDSDSDSGSSSYESCGSRGSDDGYDSDYTYDECEKAEEAAGGWGDDYHALLEQIEESRDACHEVSIALSEVRA
jgi:hypothetical protein